MRSSRLLLIPLALALAVVPACDDTKKPGTIKPRETLHKTTQNVLNLPEALKDGGTLADTTIPVSDPLTQNAAAYRTSVAKIGGMAVEQAIQIRNAQNIMEDPKPLTYDQFMAEIIKKDQPDGVSLALLPYYQEYAWDEATQKLVVVDFPARKEQFQKEQDERFGR
ncbi:MAG: hypothetical protein ABI353_19260 [Isosphaeraceae bacterium]